MMREEGIGGMKMSSTFAKEVIDWLKAIVIAIIIVVIIKIFFFQSYLVFGESMHPTVEPGDKLIINKITYRLSDIEHQDLIVFHANENEDYIKRVIALPGDTVKYHDDVLYVNNKDVNEEYLIPNREQVDDGGPLTENFTLEEKTGYKEVPEGYLFVMGDNRRKSSDSRHFGLVPIDEVVGKASFRYAPIKEIGKLQ